MKKNIILPTKFSSKEAFCVHTYFYCIYFSYILIDKKALFLKNIKQFSIYELLEHELKLMDQILTDVFEENSILMYVEHWKNSVIKAKLAYDENHLEQIKLSKDDIFEISKTFFHSKLDAFSTILEAELSERGSNSLPHIILDHAISVFFHKVQGINIDPEFPTNTLIGHGEDVYLGYDYDHPFKVDSQQSKTITSNGKTDDSQHSVEFCAYVPFPSANTLEDIEIAHPARWNSLTQIEDVHVESARRMLIMRTVNFPSHVSARLVKGWYIDQDGTHKFGSYEVLRYERSWSGHTSYPGLLVRTWGHMSNDQQLQDWGYYPSPDYWGPKGPGRDKIPKLDKDPNNPT